MTYSGYDIKWLISNVDRSIGLAYSSMLAATSTEVKGVPFKWLELAAERHFR